MPKTPVIVIHGGAIFDINDSTEFDPKLEKNYLKTLKLSLESGYQVLQKDGSSVDAVCESIQVLENSGMFDAGRGAVFTREETNELDASIMEGLNLQAGAVACVNKIKNPIFGAKMVMEKTSHTLISGQGAHKLAELHGLEMVDPGYFFNQLMWDHFLKVKLEKEKAVGHSTVGAVAMDADGNLAAGTSTGGLTYKISGRIGDSPIIGSGNYADNSLGAISCTGSGDIFMRVVAAYSALIESKYSQNLEKSMQKVLEKIKTLGGMGGMIGIDASGKICIAKNSPGMFRGWIDKNGKVELNILGLDQLKFNLKYFSGI
jgi:beta-aspartyl-peptidase (threonine type)